jgi:hypothetical protein
VTRSRIRSARAVTPNSNVIEFRYVDDDQKRQKTSCPLEDRTRAGKVAAIVAMATNLPTAPRQDAVRMGDITFGVVLVAGIPLIMLALLYMAAVNSDPHASRGPRFGRAGTMRALTEALGPTGILAAMAGVVLLALGYWVYRLVRRPIIDIYGDGQTSAAKTGEGM